MRQISFPEVLRALDNTALPKCELVVGIAEGGIVPAALVAGKQACDLRIVRFNYRNQENIPRYPEPILLNLTTLPKNSNSILLVDDAAISGKTLNAAKSLFQGCQVKTIVFKGRADYVLFPEITECVHWPWQS